MKGRLFGSPAELGRLLRLHFLRFITALAHFSIENGSLHVFIVRSGGEVLAMLAGQRGGSLDDP